LGNFLLPDKITMEVRYQRKKEDARSFINVCSHINGWLELQFCNQNARPFLYVDKNGSELVKQQSQVFMVTPRGEQDYYCAIFMTASKVKFKKKRKYYKYYKYKYK